MLYTDGLIEARSETVMFGENRLTEVVREGLSLGAQELPSTYRDRPGYAGGVLADDCAVVVVRLP